MSIEDELRKHHEDQAVKQAAHQEKVDQTTQKERAGMPQEERAQQAWENLKAETDVSEQMKNATPEQKANWAKQENDPHHKHGNSATAAQANEQRAKQNDLKNYDFPPMNNAQKDEVWKAIQQDTNQLSESLKQSESQQQALRQKLTQKM